MREGKNVWKSLREYAIILCTACEKAEMEGKSQPYRQDVIRYHGGMIMTYLTAVLLGLLLKGTAEKLSGSSAFIGVMLMITGGVLYAAGRFSRREKSEKDISLLDVILVGLAQALAVLPGLSRSGLTISAGLLRGFPKRFAVKFSFLLSVPAVIGAALISLVEAVRLGFDVGLLPMYLAGMAAAAVSGYFAIRLLRWITSRGSVGGFAYYCWGAGIVSILLSLVA